MLHGMSRLGRGHLVQHLGDVGFPKLQQLAGQGGWLLLERHAKVLHQMLVIHN